MVDNFSIPEITCPADISIGKSVVNCGAVVYYTVDYSDNCPGSLLSMDEGLPSGSLFPVGITHNVFRVTDASGNSAICSFNVTINDNEAPAIYCPVSGDQSVSTNLFHLCTYVHSGTDWDASASDNCAINSLTYSLSGATSGNGTSLEGASFGLGTTSVTWTAVDINGNSSSCFFVVVVEDSEPPYFISCPNNIYENNTPGECHKQVNYTVSAADNCPGNFSMVQISGLPSGSGFPIGTTQNIFMATDAAGNTMLCAFFVTVFDNEFPHLNCPSDIVACQETGIDGAYISYSAPVGTDNCPGSETIQIAGLASSSLFPVGTTTNVFEVTDANGLKDTCSFDVRVNPRYVISESHSMGDGEIYTWQGNNYNTAGLYYAFYETVNDCDSIYVLNLTIHGYTINGKTRYAGKANSGNPAPNPATYSPDVYNIDNVIVILKSYPQDIELARDTSDAMGGYQFLNVMNGNYMLSYDKYSVDSMQWGNGVDAIDVTLLKYFIGIDTAADPSRKFSEKYKNASNVDNNIATNAIDISRIKAKIGSPYLLIKNFPQGNWVALDSVIAVNRSDLNINLKTICYGDYNASSTKYRDSVLNWNMVKSIPENIILVSSDFMAVSDPGYFEIPLRISSKVRDFSALGLELNYPGQEYQLVNAYMARNTSNNAPVKINPALDEIIADDNDLLVTDEAGVIRVVYATTNHYNVNANDEIIRLGFRARTDRNDLVGSGFELSGTGVIGNQYGEEDPDAYLIMPKFIVQSDPNDAEPGFDFTAYPNPFNNNADLAYSLPEDGNLIINVYNAIGELVSTLVNEAQASGKHRLTYSAETLSPGLYIFKLEFTGQGKSKCMVLKLVH